MDLAAEWLAADALGGFASGTVGGERTRRYHAPVPSLLILPGAGSSSCTGYLGGSLVRIV